MAAKKLDVGGAFEGRRIPSQADPFADDTDLELVHIRLHRKRKAALQQAFHLLGQDMSTGIRTVLYEWLRRRS